MGIEGAVLTGRSIEKQFRDVQALTGAGITLRRGEMHGLLGENGSGKTTLIRCLAGLIEPDRGEILYNNQPVHSQADPKPAIRIALVPQHPQLVPSLTLFEYLAMSSKLAEPEIRRRAEQFAGRLKLDLPLDRRGGLLPANLVTAGVITGALIGSPDYLILDEPTTSFTPYETERLFNLLRELAEEGTGVLLVSHKISEIHSRVDRLTLLRRGATVTETRPEETDLSQVSRMLMGDGEPMPVIESVATGDVCLEARSLSRHSRENSLHDLSFSLRRGEILALSGIRENGLDCLEELLSARMAPDSGELLLAEEGSYPGSPRELRLRGVSLVPSDRIESGAAIALSIADNGALLVRRSLSRRGLLTSSAREAYTSELMSEYGIDASPRLPAAVLSGGMLQRLILGRELEANTDLLILCEPAWGLDVRSREEIYRRILILKEQGKGILLLASDIDEVLEIADRLLVLYDGKIISGFERSQFDHNLIGKAMLGVVPPEVRNA